MSMNRQVKSVLMPCVLCTALLLTGCAGTELGEWNQKISDAAHSLASGGKRWQRWYQRRWHALDDPGRYFRAPAGCASYVYAPGGR